MKYLIAIAVLFVACKKEDRACYTCTQQYIVYTSGGNEFKADTTKYCHKTESDIEDIINSAPYGRIDDKHYSKKICKKQ